MGAGGRDSTILRSELMRGSRKARELGRWLLLALGVCLLTCAAWILWAPWPDQVSQPLPWKPDAIVILGGGDDDRVMQGKFLADRYSDLPLIVTGDGGSIVKGLVANGLPVSRITHEQNSHSTMENAILTTPILNRMKAQRVVVVTNWFQVPRSLAVCRHQLPKIEFAASFERKPEPLTPWDRGAQRRERLATLVYLFRYGVWSW